VRYRVLCAVATVVCLLFSSAGGAFAAVTLDAQQTDTSGNVDTWQYTNLRLLQNFKAMTDGQLTSVAVDANSYGQQVEFEVLGLTTDDQFVSSMSGWTTINLTSPIHVLPGATYRIMMSVPNKFQWLGECGSVYSGGEADVLYQNVDTSVPAFGVAHSGGLGTLGQYCTLAFAFKTWVTTPDAATPVPTPKPAPTAGSKAAATATLAASASAGPSADSSTSITPASTDSPSATDTSSAAANQSTPAPSVAPAAPVGSSSGASSILLLLAVIVGLAVVGGGGAWLYLRRRPRPQG
jgi:hypothetical protein